MRVYGILAGVTALLITFSLANRAGSEPPIETSKDGWCGDYTVFNGCGRTGQRVTITKDGDHYRLNGLRDYAEECKFVEVKPGVLKAGSHLETIRRGTLRFENDTGSTPVLHVRLCYEMIYLIAAPSADSDKKPEVEKPTPPAEQIETKLRAVRKQLEALRQEEQDLEKAKAVLSAAGSSLPGQADQKLNGTWVTESVTINGKERKEEKGVALKINNGLVSVRKPGQKGLILMLWTTVEGELKYRELSSRRFDTFLNYGKGFYYSFKVEGDTLTIDGQAAFTASEGEWVLKRKQPK